MKTESVMLEMTRYNILEEELSRPSVFKDESKFSIDFIPSQLLYREQELKYLARHYSQFFSFENPSAKHLTIIGPIGSGKTSLGKRFGNMLEQASTRRGIRAKYVHVNCRKENTPYLVLLKVAKELTKHIPTRGYSTNEVLGVLVDLISSTNTRLFIVLDEFDYLINRGGNELLYHLTRINEELRTNTQVKKQIVSLLVISRTPYILKRLDPSTLSSFGNSTLTIKRYSEEQLRGILNQRVKLGFKEGVVSPEAVQLAADIASELGDARYALELIWKAGVYADENSSLFVFPDHIRKAKAMTHPVIERETIINLPRQKKLLLLGIVRTFKHLNTAYITTKDAFTNYAIACEEFHETPRSHTQVWQYLKELAEFDLIAIRISGPGHRGKTTLISLPDVPARELEKELLQIIQTTV